MPILSFDVLGPPREPEDIVVSRMASPKSKPQVRMPMRRRVATSTLAHFQPTAIETTLRQRQGLAQTALSRSAPTLILGSTGISSAQKPEAKPMMPRIGTARSCGRVDERLGRSGPCHAKPNFGGDWRDYIRWSATSTDGTYWGNIGGVTLTTSPLPGKEVNRFSGILAGDYRFELPFDHFQQDDDKVDADAFVRWYKDREADRDADMGRRRCKLAKDAVLPWETERNACLSQLEFKGMDKDSGKALRLLGKADLYDELDFKGPLPGLEALLHAISFRLDGLENAVKVLDSNGTGYLGLLEFTGSMGLLNIDVQKITGMEEHVVFHCITRYTDGLVKLENLIRLQEAFKSRPPEDPEAEEERKKAEEEKKKTMTPEQLKEMEALYGPGGPNEPVQMDEMRLILPQGMSGDVLKASAKWTRIARWMAAASQRRIALRTERLLKGWRVKELGEGEAAGAAEESAAESLSPSPKRPVAQTVQRKTFASKRPRSTSSMSSDDGPPPRRRPPTSNPREMIQESLAIMQDQEPALRALFHVAASKKLEDGSAEMIREDLHTFFNDLHLACPARARQFADWHRNDLSPLLDKLFDEAIALQKPYTETANALTFWSLKVILNNFVPKTGLSWRILTETSMDPEALGEAIRAADCSSTLAK